jgi:hypothetical protein
VKLILRVRNGITMLALIVKDVNINYDERCIVVLEEICWFWLYCG